MNKFTNKDLMNAMGLNVGDRVKVKGRIYVIDNLYTLICMDDKPKEAEFDTLNITILVRDEINFDILPKPKRVGDLECSGNCKNCSLMSVCSWDSDFQGKKIYEVLDYELTTIHDDKEIYDLLKARLDKEVLE